MIKIGSIVIRVDDLERQKAFWTAALDYLPREGDGDDFALLRPRNGMGPNLSLDRMRSTLQIPPRIHLDLYADDQAAEVERLKALGATGGTSRGRARTRGHSTERVPFAHAPRRLDRHPRRRPRAAEGVLDRRARLRRPSG